MGRVTGNGWICFAQHVLNHLNINKIKNKELSQLIGCAEGQAWRIMNELGWTKYRPSTEVAFEYTRDGMHKRFVNGATGKRMFNRWLRQQALEEKYQEIHI